MRRVLAAAAFALLLLEASRAQGGDPTSPEALAGHPLPAAAEKLGAKLSWDPLTYTGFLEREGHRAAFKLDFPWILLDGAQLLRSPAVKLKDGIPFLSAASLAALDEWFTRTAEEKATQFHIAAILIDPGHGGKDPGAVGEHVLEGKKRRIVEKDISLAVAHRIRDRLKERWPDRKILMTRDSDIYPTLEERVDKANTVQLGKNEAVIYVSIHANASFNKNARGFEVWYLNPEYRRKLVDGEGAAGTDKEILPILNLMLEEEFTTESVLLAKRILDNLGAMIGAVSPSRGLRAEEWFVVRNAKMPSVLVELGFVTNAQDALLLGQEDHLRKLGDGIYTGIVDFVEYFENRKGSAAP